MGAAEQESTSNVATRSQAVLVAPEALANAGRVRDESVTAKNAVLLPGQAKPDEAKVAEPVRDPDALIEENQALVQKLLMGYEGKWFKVDKSELARLREMLEFGSYKWSSEYVMCLSHELVRLLDALIDAPETRPGATFEILSLIRKPSVWNPKTERPPNHGRTLPESEFMTDLKGRTVNAMSTAVDISCFGGHAINLHKMGPKEGAPLSDEDKEKILAKREATLQGVLGVLRNMPIGRYNLGLPRPIKPDFDRKLSEDDKAYSCHLFFRSSGSPKSPTGKYLSDVERIVDDRARAELPVALGALSTQGDLKPHPRQPLKNGILYLFPDAKDHMHITVLQPSDDWTKPKHDPASAETQPAAK